MRHKDLELMKRIQTFVEDFYFEEGRSPSTAEIGKAVGIAKGTAHRYLVEMSKKGQSDYDGKSIKTEKIRCLSPTSCAEIFTGAIPCGPLVYRPSCADSTKRPLDRECEVLSGEASRKRRLSSFQLDAFIVIKVDKFINDFSGLPERIYFLVVDTLRLENGEEIFSHCVVITVSPSYRLRYCCHTGPGS